MDIQDSSKLFRAGFDAFHNGQPKGDNPYAGDEAAYWNLGWDNGESGGDGSYQ